jgi:hypothetical protein
MIEAGLLDRLMERVGDDGLRLTGEGGFLPEMIKAVLERGLQAELTDHLGYEKGDPAGRGSPNSRNGSTPKTLGTEVGEVPLAVPRDRQSTFEPRLGCADDRQTRKHSGVYNAVRRVDVAPQVAVLGRKHLQPGQQPRHQRLSRRTIQLHRIVQHRSHIVLGIHQ